MRLPIGVMDVSAPSVNSPIPTIISNAPIRNDNNKPVGTGCIDRHIIATMMIIGKVDTKDSLIFSVIRARFLCTACASILLSFFASFFFITFLIIHKYSLYCKNIIITYYLPKFYTLVRRFGF